MAYKNVEKARIYQRDYHLKHIEKKKKQKAERYQRIKEYQKEWSRKKYAENKEFYKERNKLYSRTIKARFGLLRRTAIRRGYEVSLSFEEFTDLVSKPCRYCGENNEMMGIDRRDNNIGYLFSNAEPCCKTCNMMKHVLNIDKFLSQVSKIHKFIS